MEPWNPERIFGRARQYLHFGYEHEREDIRFGIWLVLALEQLARSTLAMVHPVLLAAMKEDQILHAFGAHTEDPQSVGASTVFSRCAKILPRFGDSERDFCARMAAMRNAALHSAEAAFESIPASDWFGQYVRVTSILLDASGRQPSDFFPTDALTTVSTVLAADMERVRIEVTKRIGQARKAFEALPEGDQERLTRDSAIDATNDVSAVCPACRGHGWMEVAFQGQLAPLVLETAIVPRLVGLPSAFHCLSCGLELDGWDDLEAAGLGSELMMPDLPRFLDEPP